MTIRLYNTMTGKVEPLIPRVKGKVGMYVCGPTVYDYSHIGHARTYMAFDVIVRYLRYRGYNVKYVVNITNIDDKIINRAKESGVDPLELADRFEKVFYDDMDALGVIKADAYPRVSDHIPEIISMIQTLIEKEYGYEVDGNVYFNIGRVDDYGKLSHQSMDGIKVGARVEVDDKKRNPADFTMWKSSKEGEPSWGSPWSEGRPGWHIECSAISRKYLGEQFTIHGGARDLIFPHHENETAQSEACCGRKQFVKYWLHTGFLTINGAKMSKSLGNFITIKDLLHSYKAEVFRLFILSTHYSRPINFSVRALSHSKQSLKRVYGTVDNLRMQIESAHDNSRDDKMETELRRQSRKIKKKIIKAMDEDFNTQRALTEFYRMIKIGNKAIADNATKSTLTDILDAIMEVAEIFGILKREQKREALPEEINMVIKQREFARSRKDWEKADEIRAKLKDMGIILEDYPEGTRWRYIK